MTRYHRIGRRLAWLVAASLAMVACEEESVGSELDGYWQSRGYGLILWNDGDESREIEWTEASCLVTRERSIDSIRSSLVGAPDLENGSFALGRAATLSTRMFDRLDEAAFRERCPDGLTEETDDPELNFEVLWRTFDQHYAFFEKRNIDWNAIYAAYRPRVTQDMSDRALGRLMDDMLEGIGDGHVGLTVDGRDVVWIDSRADRRFQNECRRLEGEDCDVGDYYRGQVRAYKEIINSGYLDDDVETALDGSARWGQIDDRTGYFRIDAMSGFARGGAVADLEEINEALDDMLDDIGDLPAMILDVRLNQGGHDTVAVAIANRFADQRRVFGSKAPFFEGTELEATDMVIEPHDGQRYEGDVAVLIGGYTISAGEIFVMAMRALPHATIVGERTYGILSDELYRSLPNGWSFSLSNEIYRTFDGHVYEEVGIPPAVEAPFMLPEAIEEEVDSGIDAALALFAERGGATVESQ